MREILCHGVADGFHLPASQRQMKKDISLCVLSALSEAGGNSFKLKITTYYVFYFMHSIVREWTAHCHAILDFPLVDR
jgi:hypothetical protein